MLKQYPLPVALSICLTAGVFAALVSTAAFWAGGHFGILHSLGVNLSPIWEWSWIKPRLLWGAFWGIGYLPVGRLSSHPFPAALLYGLVPAAFQLLYYFPQRTGGGWFGLNHGTWTPLVIVAVSLVFGFALWGWAALCGRR
ncbi:MAG TPA: hypothetical protein VIU40_12475 [Geobacteraceae bacterium]